MKSQHKNKLTKWLELLQQESWQLELIISGFAIFLMLGLYEPLMDIRLQLGLLALGFKYSTIFSLPWFILYGAWFFLLINLVVHLLLRGLWIATIGLRYVSSDIDFEALSLQPRFENFLRKKIGSFDLYIERLEKLCSIVFAFAFLIVFMLISVGMYFLFLALIGIFIADFIKPNFGSGTTAAFSIITMTFFWLTGLLYFIDFVTLGFIKRIKWLSRIYYPIYRFYGLLTLAFISRPLYYNLIDNKFGRRIGFFLVPYMIIVLLLSSIRIETHVYIPKDAEKQSLDFNFYDDQRAENDAISKVSTPSKFLKNNFLEIFIAYNPVNDDPTLKLICPDLEPDRSAGFKMDGAVKFTSSKVKKVMDPDSAMICLSSLIEISIDDSLYNALEYHFYEHPNHGEKGLISIIDVKNLERGRHELLIKKQGIKRVDDANSVVQKEFASIPFWKE